MTRSSSYRATLTAERDITRAVEEVVSLFAVQGGKPDRQDDLRTALTESCMNALEHGARSECEVRVFMEGAGVVVEVEDHGPPFVLPGRRPDMEERIEGKKRARGWGLYLITQLADTCTVVRLRDGNVVLMRFNVLTAKGGTRHG